jgi:cobalt-zinc-cadmium resistance protein CzcA
LNEKGKAIEALVRKIDGASSVEMEQISGEAQLVIRPNRDILIVHTRVKFVCFILNY